MKKWFLAAAAIVVVLAGGFVAVSSIGVMEPSPPVRVTLRDAVLKRDGVVIQLATLEDSKRLEAYLFVWEDGKTEGKPTLCRSFILDPRKTHELGWMELGRTSVPGDHGFLAIKGYRKKVYFKIIRTWEGYQLETSVR